MTATPNSPSRPATPTTGSRAEPLIGVLFAVLFFLALVIVSTPDNGDDDAKWTSYFASSSHRTGLMASSILLVLASLCLLWFLTTLWSRIAAAQRPESLSPLPLAAATVAAACIAIGGALRGVVAAAMALGSLPEPSPDILRLTDTILGGRLPGCRAARGGAHPSAGADAVARCRRTRCLRADHVARNARARGAGFRGTGRGAGNHGCDRRRRAPPTHRLSRDP